jgi:hypothetical protein
LRESSSTTPGEEDAYGDRQAIRKVTALLSVEEELADVNAAERVTKGDNGKIKFRSRWYVPPLSRVKADEIALMKDLKKAKLDALRPQNQPTQEAQLAEVERLEREHSQSGKQLVEAEGSVTKKQSELSRWRVEKEEVGKLEVGDEGAWADGKVYVPL